MKTVEFFFDVGSPTAYLAWSQIPAIAAKYGAQLIYKPMLLGGVFKATGNSSPVSVPAKGKWMHSDLKLWAKRYSVSYQHNPHFPINTITLMRGAIGMQRQHPDQFDLYLSTVMNAMWNEPKNMGDATVLAETLTAVGIDPAAFVAIVSADETKAALIANTEEAVSRGVFGAPTFFVDGRMYFGQDRLMFVEEALSS